MARKTVPITWTLEELHRLPDDGNKYELVRGELFATPAPRPAHEAIVVVLADTIGDYVRREKVGRVFRPRAVVRIEDSEVEPDLFVRPGGRIGPVEWEDAPLPLLVEEVLSDTTRRRDHGAKRTLYTDAGIPDYWIVDGEARTIRVVRPGADDRVVSDALEWHPARAAAPLVLDVRAVFREALGS